MPAVVKYFVMQSAQALASAGWLRYSLVRVGVYRRGGWMSPDVMRALAISVSILIAVVIFITVITFVTIRRAEAEMVEDAKRHRGPAH